MKTVLLVEDNELTRAMIKRQLEKAGYRVIATDCGKCAIDIARRENPGLIVLDTSLPSWDALDAARSFRKLKSTEMIPILALTARAKVEDFEATLDAGCSDYIGKPVDFPLLINKVHRLSKHS